MNPKKGKIKVYKTMNPGGNRNLTGQDLKTRTTKGLSTVAASSKDLINLGSVETLNTTNLNTDPSLTNNTINTVESKSSSNKPKKLDLASSRKISTEIKPSSKQIPKIRIEITPRVSETVPTKKSIPQKRGSVILNIPPNIVKTVSNDNLHKKNKITTPQTKNTFNTKSRVRNNSNSFSASFIKSLTKKSSIDNKTTYNSKFITKEIPISLYSDTSQSSKSNSPNKTDVGSNYQIKKMVDLISKMKNLLKESANDKFDLLLSKSESSSMKDKIDTEMKRNMLFFEIDRLRSETGDFYSSLKSINDNNISSIRETNNSSDIKTSSDRRVSIYKKFFELCNDGMAEIKQLVIKSIKISETNNYIHNIKITEKSNTENTTNNIGNIIYNQSGNNSNKNVNLNVNLNLNTINQMERNTSSKIFKRKMSRKKHTKGRFDLDDDMLDCDEFNEDVQVKKVPMRNYLVKKPKDGSFINFRMFTEGNAYSDDDNSDDDDTIRMYNYEASNNFMKMRSKSLLDLKKRRDTKEKSNFLLIKTFKDNNSIDHMDVQSIDSHFSDSSIINLDSNNAI